MPRFVALFRGINVGKAKRIAMADLRDLLGNLGFTEVATLLNSGNAVFTAAPEPAIKLAERIRQAVLKKTGVDALVVVKSAKEVEGIIAGNALGDVADDPSRLLIAVTHDGKALAALKPLESGKWGNERIHVGKYAVYLWCANGILESQAIVALFQGLNNTVTTRNWATLTRIHAALIQRVADGR